MTGDLAGPCQVVVGVGVNVSMPKNSATKIEQRWTDLEAMGVKAPDRNLVLATLLNNIMPLLRDFEGSGFKPWRSEWMMRDAHARQPVVISSGDNRLAGIACGVDEAGALLLETDLGIQCIHAGEVSLRPAG